MIDLQDPGFEARIEHNVEPEYFKAHGILKVIWLTTFVNMGQLGLYRTNSLDDGLLDISLNLLNIVSLRLQVAPNVSERAFVPNAIVVLALVLDKLRTVLVDRVVCQVHEQIIQVIIGWRGVLFSCKS